MIFWISFALADSICWSDWLSISAEMGMASPGNNLGGVLKAADMMFPWESAERKNENWMAGDHRCYHAWHPKQCAPPRSRGPAPSPALAAREGAKGGTKLKGGKRPLE